MNIFNKVIVVLILIFFIFVAFLSIANEVAGLFSWSGIAARVFNPLNNVSPYISIPVMLLVLVACVLLLLLEFYRRKIKIAKVYNVESGKAMITLETISQQIKEAVIQLDGLKNLKVNVVSKSGGVIINMLVELGQSLNIPEKMSEIIKIAREVAINKLNIKVIDTNLTITNLTPEEGAAQAKKQETTVPPTYEKSQSQAKEDTKQDNPQNNNMNIAGTGSNTEYNSEKTDESDS
jgi:hypothetical protein